MIVNKVKTKDQGSCNYCIDAYNTSVYQFTRELNGGIQTRICKKCLDELIKKVKKLN